MRDLQTKCFDSKPNIFTEGHNKEITVCPLHVRGLEPLPGPDLQQRGHVSHPGIHQVVSDENLVKKNDFFLNFQYGTHFRYPRPLRKRKDSLVYRFLGDGHISHISLNGTPWSSSFNGVGSFDHRIQNLEPESRIQNFNGVGSFDQALCGRIQNLEPETRIQSQKPESRT